MRGDQGDLARVGPLHRLQTREACCLQDADGEGVGAERADGPVQTQVRRLAHRGVVVLRRSRVHGLLRRHALTHDLSKVRDVKERVIRLDAIEAPLVDRGVDERRVVGRRGANALRRWLYFVAEGVHGAPAAGVEGTALFGHPGARELPGLAAGPFNSASSKGGSSLNTIASL